MRALTELRDPVAVAFAAAAALAALWLGHDLIAITAAILAVLIRDSTNKEIAERLVLSERTIDNHVQNIMNKLNLHHRAQIASWVTERNTAKGPIVGDVETSLPRRPPRP